ncbi:hypothetical protein GUY44_07530 [Pimelobacter simplex]|uniref:Uncharacterized protein n=1 Tax=Nocardioides simplex TaxID=2045 RepID=A0A0A1DH16_NOCSI|nr:hypothetical protein [Pimelobacter simplex]AIY15823.1 hypothetical protein KR76_01845 [Pimelobacter simplex]MCG8150325.1 hypothetical protein [Pimelobacter simplex]GEB16691.1 hypothetical protein NSI01_50060 [Pimelobacter simplex]SFM89942.1 hypothetical protein SAMN05421671_4092 [Pimelobacter simplex]
MTDHDITAQHGVRDHLDRGQPATDRAASCPECPDAEPAMGCAACGTPLPETAGLAELRGEISLLFPDARTGSPNYRHRRRLLDLLAAAEQEQARLTDWVLTLGGDAERAEAQAPRPRSRATMPERDEAAELAAFFHRQWCASSHHLTEFCQRQMAPGGLDHDKARTLMASSWLADHDRQIAERAWEEGAQAEYDLDRGHIDESSNPYSEEAHRG